MASVSVILPCYNAGRTLGVQLAALTRQRWRGACEIVIVDNGSTDQSMDRVEEYRPELPPVRILQAYNADVGRLGVAYSYALGFRAAAGDALLICEADDEVAGDWFEKMADALDAHEMVACALEYHKLNPAEFRPTGFGLQAHASGLPSFSTKINLPYAFGCALGLRKSVVTKIGFPTLEQGTAWDVDYCLKAGLAGIHIQFVPDAVIHYRLRQDLSSRFKQAREWGRSYVNLHAKYEPRSLRRNVLSAGKRMLVSLCRLRWIVVERRTVRYWAWDFGWAVGILTGTKGLIVTARKQRRVTSYANKRTASRPNEWSGWH